jgi:hypothetical protein
MSRKRPGWKTQRNLYNAITREMAALAEAHAPPPIQGCALPPMELTSKPKKIVTPRAKREMTEREAAIRQWYMYGDADAEPPEGLTEAELENVRRRFC